MFDDLSFANRTNDSRIQDVHQGIKEIESATENPLTLTAHFPANIFYGDVSNSTIKPWILGVHLRHGYLVCLLVADLQVYLLIT